MDCGQTAERIEMKLGAKVDLDLAQLRSPTGKGREVGGEFHPTVNNRNILMLRYLENGERYEVGLNGGPMGKHP